MGKNRRVRNNMENTRNKSSSSPSILWILAGMPVSDILWVTTGGGWIAGIATCFYLALTQ